MKMAAKIDKFHFTCIIGQSTYMQVKHFQEVVYFKLAKLEQGLFAMPTIKPDI